MATTSTQATSVDVGALAAAIKVDVTDRLSTVPVEGFESLEEDGRELNQIQRAHLTQWAFDSFDGLERQIASIIVEFLTAEGIEVWGLPTALADLLPKDGDDG